MGLVKTSPSQTHPSQNVPESEWVKKSPKIGLNIPMVKNAGQNIYKMNFILYFMKFYAESGKFE